MSEHVVLKGNGTAVCLHCKHELKFEYPVGLEDLADAWAGFDRRHKKCKKPEGRNPLTDPITLDEWVASADTGISSMFIYSVFYDVPVARNDPPSDPSDFGRCYRVLKLIPEAKGRLWKVSRRNPAWKGLVDNWDELVALYEEELPSGKAPKLFARMKELLP